MRTINVGGVAIELEKKRVRRINLRVVPGGKVKMSVPVSASEREAVAFAAKHLDWIIKHLESARKDNFMSFINDGKIKIFGEEYVLVRAVGKTALRLENGTAYLTMPETADEVNALKKKLAEILTAHLEKRIAFWSRRTGLVPTGFTLRNMKSRWGTCNISTHKLCFNLQLVKKPPECIDYVVVHELGHLVNARHDARFHHYMDLNYPDWRAVRKRLNGNT